MFEKMLPIWGHAGLILCFYTLSILYNFKTLSCILYYCILHKCMPLFHKIFHVMANSADPDHTVPLGAVWSRTALFVCTILSGKFMYENLGQSQNCVPLSSLTWIGPHSMPVVFKYLCGWIARILGIRNIFNSRLPVRSISEKEH